MIQTMLMTWIIVRIYDLPRKVKHLQRPNGSYMREHVSWIIDGLSGNRGWITPYLLSHSGDIMMATEEDCWYSKNDIGYILNPQGIVLYNYSIMKRR